MFLYYCWILDVFHRLDRSNNEIGKSQENMPTSKRISSEKNRATQYIACISLGMNHCSGQKGLHVTMQTVAYVWLLYYYGISKIKLPYFYSE